MIKVTWITNDGAAHEADVAEGTNLMDAAVFNGIAGVPGECGGGLMCATCHVYVEPPHAELLGPPGDVEADLLDTTDAPRLRASRLSCQIVAAPELDGIVLRVPPSGW